MRKLLLHFEFIKKTLQDNEMTEEKFAEMMAKEFNVTLSYVYKEVNELVSLKKIIKKRYNNDTLLCWTKEILKFEYELESNKIELDRQFVIFRTISNKYRQMRFPTFMYKELKKHIVGLDENADIMLEIKAIKSDGVWYSIKQKEVT